MGSGQQLDSNSKFISEFKDHLKLKEHLSDKRIGKYEIYLPHVLSKLNKDVKKLTEKDIERFVKDVKESDMKPTPKQMYKILIKKLIQFTKGKRG